MFYYSTLTSHPFEHIHQDAMLDISNDLLETDETGKNFTIYMACFCVKICVLNVSLILKTFLKPDTQSGFRKG